MPKTFTLIDSIYFLDATRQAEHAVRQARLKRFVEAVVNEPQAQREIVAETWKRYLGVPPSDG